jgi:hypothetical protein
MKILDFMKIRLVGAEFFCADRQMDMMKVRVTSHKFMKASKKKHQPVENDCLLYCNKMWEGRLEYVRLE